MVGWRFVLVVVACLGAVAVACQRGPVGFDPETALKIEEPQSGAQVSQPFTVRMSSSVGIGDKYRVRVYKNGLEGPIVTTDSFEVSDLPPGPNGIAVSLIDDRGERVGGDDDVQVTVAGG